VATDPADPGLFDQPELPAWQLLTVDDLGHADHECEHCRNERVRYVHVLRGRDGRLLRVGCVCAEKLTNDPATPRHLETAARNRAKRYASWAADAAWTIDETYHCRQGRRLHWEYTVVVAESPDKRWRWRVSVPVRTTECATDFASAAEAKRHFFDTWLEPR
jgi:hypothetical protein